MEQTREAAETLEAGGLVFELRRSVRRRTLGLTVDRGGELVVHAPEGSAREEICDYVRSRLLWVHGKLAEKERLRPRTAGLEFVTGESVFYLGQPLRLKVGRGLERELECDGNRFHLDAVAPDPEEAFRRWFLREGKGVIGRRVEWFQQRTARRPSSVRLRDLGYRWGSCSAKGALNFHWVLLQLPMRLIDYVVAHELTHLAVPDHSPAFWKALRAAMPDCREREAELAGEARRFVQFRAGGGGPFAASQGGASD